MGNVLFEGFQYSNHHLLFLAIFPDVEMLRFQSVNYICQVCKLYFYFGYVGNLGQYLWLSILVNSESVVLLAFVKYMLCSHCTQSCIFCTFGGKKPLFSDEKLFKIFLYFCIYFVQKQHNYSRKSSINQEQLDVESCPTLC